MSDLRIPEQLRGPWEHAVFLTYGADLPFFERAIWGELSPRCRNVVILADGAALRDAAGGYARGDVVRHLNQRYLADGIESAHAAHAKLILLANREEGRLLVGSGNLGLQGYASGGELFTRYDFGPERHEALGAFLSARELLDWLAKQGLVTPPAARRLRHLCEAVPWLYQTPPDDARPVRHNLARSFHGQLREVVGDAPVEELWILAPFYDEEADALARLLATFQPRETTILVQPHRTALDSAALRRVIEGAPGPCLVRPFRKEAEDPYVHAKLYLLKLADRAVCLQGSPNLSRVALLRTPPAGNIELANLLQGPRDAFDELFAALAIEDPTTDLDALQLRFEPADHAAPPVAAAWYLTGGEWHGDRLTLFRRGPWPALADAQLVIDAQPFPLTAHVESPSLIELVLPAEAAALLQRPAPTLIRWGDSDAGIATNPVFVANRAALTAALNAPDDARNLDRVGDLALNDEEFEQLLDELNAALLIDRRSVWRLAGREVPSDKTDTDDEAYRLDYAAIDYEKLRQHPKLQQYLHPAMGQQGYGQSRLQQILAAITDHFQELLTPRQLPTVPVQSSLTDDEEAEPDGAEDVAQTMIPWTLSQRRQRLLKNFIRRYLRGLRSPDFQELVGYEAMAQNYVIFAHILWRLYAKGWVEEEFVLDALLETWQCFWGDGQQPGYFAQCDEAAREQVQRLVRTHHADAELLAALYHGARLTVTNRWESRRLALRDFARAFFAQLPCIMSGEVLDEAVVALRSLLPYSPPTADTIVRELVALTRFDTLPRFLRDVEQRYQLPTGSSRFTREEVNLHGRKQKVTCLILQGEGALADLAMAIDVLRGWQRLEELDHYRIEVPTLRRIFYYDPAARSGVYWARDRHRREQDIGALPDAVPPWEYTLLTLLLPERKPSAEHPETNLHRTAS